MISFSKAAHVSLASDVSRQPAIPKVSVFVPVDNLETEIQIDG